MNAMNNAELRQARKRVNPMRGLGSNFVRHWQLYLLVLPGVVFFALFYYWPMYGLQLAFRDFNILKGISGSRFVGLENFQRFFSSYNFWTLMKNTLGISFYQLAVGFPIPILFALMINEISSSRTRKTMQMVSYAPHFISTVVVVSMLDVFFSQSSGFINQILMNVFGFEKGIPFMASNAWFKTMYVFSGVWQNAGYSAIVYIAALTGVDPQVQEAAIVDGATKLKRIWHVQIPAILPTIITLLILECGNVMKVGFEKVLLMQNPLNMASSDIISTYVYRIGLMGADFSFGTTADLFNSVVSCIVLVTVNFISRKVSENSLW